MPADSCLLCPFPPTFLLQLLLLKMKNKEAKDKEKPNRHQFVPGTFSGVLQCSGCEKTLLGKESLQCASKSSNPACDEFSLHPVSSPRVKPLLSTFTQPSLEGLAYHRAVCFAVVKTGCLVLFICGWWLSYVQAWQPLCLLDVSLLSNVACLKLSPCSQLSAYRQADPPSTPDRSSWQDCRGFVHDSHFSCATASPLATLLALFSVCVSSPSTCQPTAALTALKPPFL